MSKYTVEYFLDKFEAIPEDQWCTGGLADQDGRRCAYGHCCNIDKFGVNFTDESRALLQLGWYPTVVNDGHSPRYQQPTPKQRVLAALRDLKGKAVQ